MKLMTEGEKRLTAVIEPSEPLAPRPSTLYRWGVTVARHRRVVLAAWALALLLCVALYPSLKQALGAPEYGVAGSESQRVEQLVERNFPGIGSEDDALVFYSRRHVAQDHTYRGAIASVIAAVRGKEGVRSVLGPFDSEAVGQISSDGHAVVAVATLSGSARQRFDRAKRIQSSVAPLSNEDVRVWLTGYSPIARDLSEVEITDTEHAELIGVPVALVVLLLALGAPLAAMVPLMLAGVGLMLTYGVLGVLAVVGSLDSLVLAIATMIGVGIGIDYSLFIVSRFREELARTGEPGRSESERVAEAVGAALATSGRTILFSGVIVALSLVSLFVVDVPLFHEVALGSVAVVTCMLIASLTFLPAVLGLLGSRINSGAPARLQPADARLQSEQKTGGWARWALLIMRHPIPAAGVATAMLILAAMPALGMHYGIDLGVLSLSNTSSGKGEQVLSRSFAPGGVSPVQVVTVGRNGGSLTGPETARVKVLQEKLENDQRVAGVLERRSHTGVLLTVVTSVSIDSTAATALVNHIRDDLAPRMGTRGNPKVLVGGTTAKVLDLSKETSSKLLPMLSVILGLSLLFLLVVFRSIVLPIKAVAMNLLATAATMGLVVFVFQRGHGEHLLGFTSTGFIQAYLPLTVFALLFGLSMDYEVFLIRRIQEERRKTGENRLAIAAGIEHTARPISAAAAIMVAVFGSFMTAGTLELKQYGFALAVAVALDATVIRLFLVPALMRLLGNRNWWLPAPLARALPDVTLD